MSWYVLAVLQVTAMSGGAGYTAVGWNVLGEFRGEKACLHAAQQLRDEQATSRSSMHPQKFVCLRKEMQ